MSSTGFAVSGTLTAASLSSSFGSLIQANISTLTAAVGGFVGSLSAAGNVLATTSGRSYVYNAGIVSNAAGSVTDDGTRKVGVVFSAGSYVDLVNSANTSMLRVAGTCVGI